MENEPLKARSSFFIFHSVLFTTIVLSLICASASAQTNTQPNKGWVYVTQIVESSTQLEESMMTLDGEPVPTLFKKRITLGLVLDDQGHVITRLIDKHPRNITIETTEIIPAEFIGTDSISGFSVIRADKSMLTSAVFSTKTSTVFRSYVRLFGFTNTKNTSGKYPKADYYEGKIIKDVKDFRFSPGANIHHLSSPGFGPGQDCSLVLNRNGSIFGLALYDASIRGNIHLVYPITEIKKISDAVIKFQHNLSHGWLGATATDEKRASRTYHKPGVRVTSVAPNSPAEAAGLARGDIVSTVNSQQVVNFSQLANVMQQIRPGNEVTLEVIRDNEMKNLKATLVPTPTVDTKLLVFYGIEVQQLTSQLMEFFGVTNGILITNVLQQNLSVEAGDVIIKVGDKNINSIIDLINSLASYSNQSVPLTISRKRNEIKVDFRVQ